MASRRTPAIIALVVSLAGCGGGLSDAQLVWCLDTTPNGTKETVAYPDDLGGGGLAATFDRMRAWENSWKLEHPGEPLPTRIVPDEFSSNSFAVLVAAGNLGIDSATNRFVPEPGEPASADYARACRAAYETR